MLYLDDMIYALYIECIHRVKVGFVINGTSSVDSAGIASPIFVFIVALVRINRGCCDGRLFNLIRWYFARCALWLSGAT